MLKQLARLSVEADGRYATASELQFLKDYLQSVDQRISAYEKIRDAEEKIIDQVEAKMRSIDPNLFLRDSQDITSVCKRDRKHTLRCSAAAMLINDLDRLRDGFLLWQRTIVQAFDIERPTEVTYQVMPEIIKQYLTAEEAELVMSVLQLDLTLLS
ncbi:MAG: allophycocyanin [Xenococcaceae cyanobacterium]